MKRLLSVLLTIMLCFAVLSAAALARSSEPESSPVELCPAEDELLTQTMNFIGDGSGLESESDMEVEELFAGYLNETLGDELFSVDGTTSESLVRSKVRDNMNNWELAVYDALLAKVPNIANGSETSTVFTINGLNFTAEECGVDNLIVFDSKEQENVLNPTASNFIGLKSQACVQKALAAAMHTCPYEMYWFNKQGHLVLIDDEYKYCSYNIELGLSVEKVENIETGTVTITLSLSVMDAYRGNGYFITNPAKTAAAAQIATNAKNIVASAKNLSDEEKILYYNNAICNAVSYYHTENADEQSYGDPWQLIYVFDGDSSTNVYCEGYAKAFQYLCDLTEFDDDSIYCITVTGTMEDENHMWNVIHWSDGMNYLADITNNDEGHLGFPDNLLRVRKDTGNLDDGYKFLNCKYTYDDITRKIFPDSMLTIYAKPGDLNENGTIGADDLIVLIKYILGDEDVPSMCTDLNNSNGTDLSDVIHLLRYLMGDSVTLNG